MSTPENKDTLATVWDSALNGYLDRYCGPGEIGGIGILLYHDSAEGVVEVRFREKGFEADKAEMRLYLEKKAKSGMTAYAYANEGEWTDPEGKTHTAVVICLEDMKVSARVVGHPFTLTGQGQPTMQGDPVLICAAEWEIFPHPQSAG